MKSHRTQKLDGCSVEVFEDGSVRVHLPANGVVLVNCELTFTRGEWVKMNKFVGMCLRELGNPRNGDGEEVTDG